MDRTEILSWLRENNQEKLNTLWQMADSTREQNVGPAVHLRGLIEFSNHCARNCGYCGLNAANKNVERYRMTEEEILECAIKAKEFGYGTVVLQSGEDYGITREFLTSVIKKIKKETNLAITLSVGERSDEELREWKENGADRYLLRFETSNKNLYKIIHPDLGDKNSDRPALLRKLREIGYEIGSGVLIGIPGQTYDDLANDIELFRKLNLDMIGVGPFIPHGETNIGKHYNEMLASEDEQVPNTEAMTYKVVALTRIVCPKSNIPSTTALATLNLAEGREFGLQRGANVVMPNLTPAKYRAMYEIYPAKACINETADQCHNCMKGRIRSIGREVGTGRGDSANFIEKLK